MSSKICIECIKDFVNSLHKTFHDKKSKPLDFNNTIPHSSLKEDEEKSILDAFDKYLTENRDIIIFNGVGYFKPTADIIITYDKWGGNISIPLPHYLDISTYNVKQKIYQHMNVLYRLFYPEDISKYNTMELSTHEKKTDTIEDTLRSVPNFISSIFQGPIMTMFSEKEKSDINRILTGNISNHRHLMEIFNAMCSKYTQLIVAPDFELNLDNNVDESDTDENKKYQEYMKQCALNYEKQRQQNDIDEESATAKNTST